jgi:hypothetical protein
LTTTVVPACTPGGARGPIAAPAPAPEAPVSEAPADVAAPADPGAELVGVDVGGATAAEPSCEARLDAAFPHPRDYEGSPQMQVVTDRAVVQCCAEMIESAGAGMGEHRWDCCYVTPDPSLQVEPLDPSVRGHACTPWGPPNPAHFGPRRAVHVSGSPRRWLDLRHVARARRPRLPADPRLDALRPAAIATWRARMVNEHASARVFEALAEQLQRLDQSDAARQARAFATEERRHGAQCGAVVEALGGHALAAVDPPSPFPSHPDAATELDALVRNVVSICCMAETVAVALIGAERLQMPEGPLRELLTRILADEVGHARFGWRLLDELAPRLDAAARARLGDYLTVAFDHLVEHELAHLPESSRPPAHGAAWGLCNGRDARRLFFDVVRDAVIPGLQARGLPAQAAWDRRAA